MFGTFAEQYFEILTLSKWALEIKNNRYANETNCETRSVGNHFKLNYLNLFYIKIGVSVRARIATNFLLFGMYALINCFTSWNNVLRRRLKADI